MLLLSLLSYNHLLEQYKLLFVGSMHAFANDFLRTLYDQLINEKNEKNELRAFIMNTIEELPEDPFI